MRKRNWIIPASLTAVATAGVWVHLLLKNAAPDTPLDPTRPDYVITDLRIIEMSAQGKPDRILEADQLRHYSQNDLTEADAPLVYLFREGVPEWNIRGQSGRLVSNRSEILLDGTVQIDRAPESDEEPVQITTSDLRILHEDQYAETQQLTVIESSRNRIEGIGLQAWFNNPVRVKLLADVRGRHDI